MAGGTAQRAILRGLVLVVAAGLFAVPAATAALADRHHRCHRGGTHHATRWERDAGRHRPRARSAQVQRQHRVRPQRPIAVAQAVVRDLPVAPAPSPPGRPASRTRPPATPPVATPPVATPTVAAPPGRPAEPPPLAVAEPRASANPLWPTLVPLIAFAVMLALISAGFSVRARLTRVDR